MVSLLKLAEITEVSVSAFMSVHSSSFSMGRSSNINSYSPSYTSLKTVITSDLH